MADQIDIARISEDEEYKQELRWRAQTDLFWLTKFMLGYSLVTEKNHREVAHVFIRKDPRKPIAKRQWRKPKPSSMQACKALNIGWSSAAMCR